MSLQTYLPQDRLRALSLGETLPDRTRGSALFADISGFTPLTEGLRESLGARQGAEELSKQLSAVYSALIAEVEKYGGSVIGFAGDSMMCWFDEAVGGTNSIVRAVSCAFGTQKVMDLFSAIPMPNGRTVALTLKAAIATGPARRFVVGDPAIQFLDALAGSTVSRTSTAEHLANKGEVLVDEATVKAIGHSITVKEWRTDVESGERFAVVGGIYDFADAMRESSLENMPSMREPIPSTALKAWVHHALYERDLAGQGTFQSEFRPCVALFVRFIGIDFDSDSAASELNTFIQQVQQILSRYDGTLMDITIGDKGSYAYINFGALSAHEDLARRAVKMALELRNQTELQLQMGITQGTLRVGAFGGATRRAFGALGDDVNLAARLMTTAAAGEVLISGHVHKAVANDFVTEPRPPLPMKGKSEPLPVFAVTGERKQRAIRLQEPTYALPMVGRQPELQLINEKLDLTLNAKGQVIGIVSEAGMGKSRLVAEVIRAARKKGFTGYGGTCQSDAVNTPYHPWKAIWQAFFDIDPSVSMSRQIRYLESQIKDIAAERAEAWPLLGILLDLDIPDNDFTKTLEPQYRQSGLRLLLEDCLRTAANDEPLLIVIEDLHWLDALSHNLLEGLAKALVEFRVCFVLAYRPPQLLRLQAPRLEAMPNYTSIELHELNAVEAEQAIRAKLAQLYPARTGGLPVGLVDKLMARSQGNPFYLEELLNHVRDRGLDPADLDQIELPDSLHTLILSRIDALSESEKTTLRVASIVGRLFRAKWLTGYYPELGDLSKVKADLDELAEMDITPLDSPEPELAYLFKHIVTHEVTYESLPFATRARLHEQLAAYLEGIDASVEAVAHHYGLSRNTAKQHEYWLKAGNAAYEAFANESALEYFERLAPLSEPHEQVDLHLKRAGAYYALGKLTEARRHLHLALDGLGQPLPAGWRTGVGLVQETLRQVWHRLRYARQPIITDHEPDGSAMSADRLKLVRAYLLLGYVDAYADTANIGDVYINLRALNFTEAEHRKSPELAQAYGSVAYCFSLLTLHRLAQSYYQRAHAALHGLENLPVQGWVLVTANTYAIGIGDWQAGERGCTRALEVCDRLGDHRNGILNRIALAYMAYLRGQYAQSLTLYSNIHQAGVASNHLEHQLFGLLGQAVILWQLGQPAQATAVAERALPIFNTMDNNFMKMLIHCVLAAAYVRQGQFSQARQNAETARLMLAQVHLPNYAHITAYDQFAEVYISLWGNEIIQKTEAADEFKAQARHACRSLHRLRRIFPIGEPGAWRWQGVYEWLDGKPGRARRAWQKSLAAAQNLQMPYDEALAYYEIGRHATGAERETYLAHARDIFDRLGVVGYDVE